MEAEAEAAGFRRGMRLGSKIENGIRLGMESDGERLTLFLELLCPI